MGPTILIDKSFLQSLSVDASVWLDHFFLVHVSHPLYIEILADLALPASQGRPPTRVVEQLADKYPDMSGSTSAYHDEMCIGNLLGFSVAMDGRIPMHGDRVSDAAGCTGARFSISPEALAFARWRRGEFEELEPVIAAATRRAVAGFDLERPRQLLRSVGISAATCRNPSEALAWVEQRIGGWTTERHLLMALRLLGVPLNYYSGIIDRWRSLRATSVQSFAPYAAFKLRVDLLFWIALASDLISAARPSNKMDFAYLYYLPFCNVFSSSDKLHKRFAPLLMRPDQEFMWGPLLKASLDHLNEGFAALSGQVTDRPIHEIATVPPLAPLSVVAELWDRHWPAWRAHTERGVPVPSSEEMHERVRRFLRQPASNTPPVGTPNEAPGIQAIERRVRISKGRWTQVRVPQLDRPAYTSDE